MPQPDLTFHKVSTMPPAATPDGVYFVLDPNGLGARMVVTTSDGSPVNLVANAPAFVQTFLQASNWVVNHNMGRKPAAIAVLSPGGVEVDAQIVHTSDNQFVVMLNPAMAGQVIVQ